MGEALQKRYFCLTKKKTEQLCDDFFVNKVQIKMFYLKIPTTTS